MARKARYPGIFGIESAMGEFVSAACAEEEGKVGEAADRRDPIVSVRREERRKAPAWAGLLGLPLGSGAKVPKGVGARPRKALGHQAEAERG